MEKNDIRNMVGGWFIGNFEPSVFRTKDFEVGYKKFLKDEDHKHHFHKVLTEVNFLIKGEIEVNGDYFKDGAIFVFAPNEVSRVKFITDCELMVIKIPSLPNDKYMV